MYNNIQNYDYSYLAGGPFGAATPCSVLVHRRLRRTRKNKENNLSLIEKILKRKKSKKTKNYL
jgi:hypothetical protein